MDKLTNNLVYLTGFMGSGKSTLGPILANTLGFSFIDTDKQVVDMTGKTIATIFSELGEQYFRDIEHKVIQEVSILKNTVIAMGGGTITFERNLILIQKTGTLVYLQANEEQLYKRLHWKSDRPLLPNKDLSSTEAGSFQNSIKSLLSIRQKYYTLSDIVVSTNGKKIGATIDEIVALLRPFLRI